MQKIFSYPVKIDELNQNRYSFILEPDSDEREDIAQVLKVEKVCAFKGEVFLKKDKKDNLLRVWGTVSAVVEVQSVISLENFEQKIVAPFELFYDTKATYKDIRDLDAGINDFVPDVIVNGEINLADVCMEQIALQLEDYPRADGEVFNFGDYTEIEPWETENPFAVLKKLKK